MNIETVVKALKNKWRFKSTKGEIQIEDLFDLSLESLDTVAVNIDEQVQKAGRKSFIGKSSESSTELNGKLDLVKFVIDFKQAENAAKKARADKASQKDFLTGLLEKKKMAALEGLSVEEITKQLEQL